CERACTNGGPFPRRRGRGVTRHQAVLFRQILLVFDVLVSAGAFLAALRLRSWMTTADLPALLGMVGMQPVSVEDYEPLVWGLLPMWFLALQWSRTSDFRVTYGRSLVRYARAVGIGLGLSVVAAFLYKVD